MLEPAFRPADIENPEEKKHLWELMSTYLSKGPSPCPFFFFFLSFSLPLSLFIRFLPPPVDIKDIQQYICNHIEYTLARTRYNLDKFAVYQATSLRFFCFPRFWLMGVK